MILVDTSVWIDFFKGAGTSQVRLLEKHILDNADIAICGIILTEILQGIRDDKQYRRVKRYLKPLILLPMDENTFIRAADLFRQLRKQGLTIRKTNDCIIAATAIQHGAALLHKDRDFEILEKNSALITANS